MSTIRIVVYIPACVESVANKRWHWSRLAKYHATMRQLSWATLQGYHRSPPKLPVIVRLTRIAPRELDGHDNLRSGLKGAADGVADWCGVKDNDRNILWEYAQERGAPKTYSLRIEVLGEE